MFNVINKEYLIVLNVELDFKRFLLLLQQIQQYQSVFNAQQIVKPVIIKYAILAIMILD